MMKKSAELLFHESLILSLCGLFCFRPLITALLVSCVFPILSFAQSGSENYILSRTYKHRGADAKDVGKVSTKIQYFDALARPVQTVALGQSPGGADLVTFSDYDAYGQVSRNYLPYPVAGQGTFQSGAAGAQAAFYSGNAAGLEGSDLGRPYSQTYFQASPEKRLSASQAPGNKSKTFNISYGSNAAGQVKRYDYVSNADLLQTITNQGHYAAGALSGRQTTDEEGRQTVEYTDKTGQLICRMAPGALATYYVYDDTGLLRAVLQPQFQDEASTDRFAFLYAYDERGRTTVRKFPSTGATELVYDRYNRPAMSRTANQKTRGVWGFIKYDGLNRPVASGEIASAASRETWAATAEAVAVHHEDRANGSQAGYSLNKTVPVNASEADLLNVTFYDDYNFSKPAALSYSPIYGAFNNAVKGKQTGSRTRILPGAGGLGGWLTSATYYDQEYRQIQTCRQLAGPGGTERQSLQYRFDLAAEVAEEKTEQLLPTGNSVHTKVMTHDHAGRLLSVKEKLVVPVDQKEAVTIAHRYNALGQLAQTWQHSADGIKFRRRTTYTHNIRGWQTLAKTAYKININGADSSFFAHSLAYHNGANYTAGNVSQMQWSGKAENSFTKGLTFSYDAAGRLSGGPGLAGYPDTETNITYDKNGNLKTLNRAGAAVDNLTYTYQGNRLTQVNDASGSNLGVKSGASSYSYDAGGNMTSDGARNATIAYNPLDLVKTVTIGGKTLSYDYDATGEKLKYTADTLTLKYAGRFEYNASDVFRRLELESGQAVIRKDTICFDYYVKDHLGNVRVVFSEMGKTLQKTDYYPFGLPINRDGAPPKVQNWVNRYLYNGKELQVGSGYLDYGARMYMPEIGRWGVVDPMGEKMPSWSPYCYGFNNPIRYIDLLGLSPSTHTDKEGNVVAVYDDGELGVYRHDGNKKEAQKDLKESYDKNNTSARGEKMGESLHALSFVNQNLYNERGIVRAADIKIDFGSTALTDKVQKVIDSDPSVIDYFNRAGTGGDWDIKAHISNGSLLYGKYASPRDAGNFAAGVVAQSSGLGAIVQYGFGAYNLTGNSKALTVAVTVGVGLLIRMNPALGLGAAYLIGKYGEDKLSQQSIDIGKEFSHRIK